MSTKVPSILLSRRAMMHLKTKQPKYFTPPKSPPKKDKDPGWPMWMQVAGGVAATLAIPYTFSVFVMQSNNFRDYLDGEIETADDDDGEEAFGRKVVRMVRWYWGTPDEIPYVEYLEQQNTPLSSSSNEEPEFSMLNEDKAIQRMIQDRIERSSRVDINVAIEADGGVVKEEILRGDKSLTEQLISNNTEANYDTSRGLILSFQDEETNSTGISTSQDEVMLDMNDENSHQTNTREIINLSSIYGMWNYFPPQEETSAASLITNRSRNGGDSWSNHLQIRMDELQYKTDEIQKLLNDPMCTRDRDEMEREMKGMRNQLVQLRREKRMAKLKKLVSF